MVVHRMSLGLCFAQKRVHRPCKEVLNVSYLLLTICLYVVSVRACDGNVIYVCTSDYDLSFSLFCLAEGLPVIPITLLSKLYSIPYLRICLICTCL
jgi:hypothetical protein